MAKYGTYMKTQHFGSKFYMGKLVKEYEESPMHYLMVGFFLITYSIKTIVYFQNDTFCLQTQWSDAKQFVINRGCGEVHSLF